MDTAYNRRIASEVDAINHRAARHAPANFVGRGYGSDCGIDTQYRDVMGSAYNHPRNLSRVERENRAEADLKMFGGNFGMMGRGDGIGGNSPGGVGGRSATMVGVTMPFREAGNPGVEDFANPLSGSAKPKFPLRTKVQVGNMDGSGEPPKVGCAWYASLEDYRGGRNRMMESKKIGRMTTMPVMPTDLTEEEEMFIEDLFKKSKEGAGYYGGEWYNNWNDFTEAIADAYDTVKGVWEDYIKPVLDVVGTPLKDALIDSGNPYGEAAGGVLELLGYGMSDGNGRPGMSGGRSGGYNRLMENKMSEGMGRPGMSGGRSGGAEVGVFANAKPIPANSLGFDPKLEVEQLNAATGSTSYGDMPTSNPVGSGMSGIGGRKKRMVKNDSGASSAPTKMGEGFEDPELNLGEDAVVITPRDSSERHEYERYTSLEKNAANDSKTARLKQAAKDILEAARRNAPELATYGRNKLLDYVADKLPAEYKSQAKFLGYALSQPYIEEWKKSIKDEVKDRKLRIGQGVLKITHGGKKRHLESDMEDQEEYRKKEEREKFEKEYGKDYGYGRGGSKASMERAGLAVSGDNSMGAIVAERGFSKKSQKKAAAVEDKAADNMWDGTKMENVAGRSGKKINSLILQDATRGQKGVSTGGAASGGVHPLTQTNNLKGVFGGGGEKSGMKRKGQSNAYSQLTKKIMAEKGMRLGEASAYIKKNGLYKKQ